MPQSIARVYIHAVFSTKHRVPNLDQEIRERLYLYIGGILNNIGCVPIQIGGTDDHIHVLYAISRTITIADSIKKLKANSSGWVSETFPRCRQFEWQPGYLVKSADPDNCESLVRYIQDQEQHHKNVSFIDELRDMLQRMGMELEERDL